MAAGETVTLAQHLEQLLPVWTLLAGFVVGGLLPALRIRSAAEPEPKMNVIGALMPRDVDLGPLGVTEHEWLREALALAILEYSKDSEAVHASRIVFLHRLLRKLSGIG